MPSSRPRVDSYPWVGGLADTENYNSPSKRRLPRIAALASSLPFYGFTLSSRSARTGAGRGVGLIMSVTKQSIMDTRRHQMFPTLEPAEIERVRRFGKVRSYDVGEP